MVKRIGIRPLLRFLRRAGATEAWAELPQVLKQRFSSAEPDWSKDKNPLPPVLFRLASGYWLSQAVYVAAKLGIADLLKDGPQLCSRVAASTGSDSSSLRRLLRALSGAGIFSVAGTDRFALNRMAEPLCSEVPGSVRQIVISLGEIHYHAWGDLLHSIKAGKPAFNRVFGSGLFEYLEGHSDAADAFDQGMTNLSAMLAHAVSLAYDFSGISSIVDIGGGKGELLKRILPLYPDMTGLVFDLPHTSQLDPALGDASIGGRFAYASGNFFEAVPAGACAYLLCNVVHDWDDEPALRVLTNCRKAVGEKGRILLVEMIVPDNDSASFSKLLDLNMLVMTGGRERTRSEFAALLGTAGFQVTRTIPTLAPQSIIEAVPRKH